MRVRPLVLTGTIAIATWWLAHTSHPLSERKAQQSVAPGYYFDDATLDETDDQGHTNLTLHTRYAVEDGPHHAIQLTDMTVDYLAAPDSVWHLKADRGTMPLGSEVLTLHGHVELRSQAPRTAGAVVWTDALALDRAHRIASTAEPARVEWPPHQLYAQGMRLDLTRQTLVLENSVHGTFHR
jgi:LPS export ABC transporter protein LptC